MSLDNDSIILGMIHDIFVQNGVHCDTCTSTGEMAEKLREGHYDLLTTDLKMQDASGYEVLELLRTSDIGNSRTIPVMVVTGSKSITKEELAGAASARCCTSRSPSTNCWQPQKNASVRTAPHA